MAEGYPKAEVILSSRDGVVHGHNMFAENRRAVVLVLRNDLTPGEAARAAARAVLDHRRECDAEDGRIKADRLREQVKSGK